VSELPEEAGRLVVAGVSFDWVSACCHIVKLSGGGEWRVWQESCSNLLLAHRWHEHGSGMGGMALLLVSGYSQICPAQNAASRGVGC
jgi:hypothetical protein